MFVKVLRIIGIFLWPTIVWIAVTVVGFGAQSLSNLMELLIVWLGSLLIILLPERVLSTKGKLLIGAILIVLLRAFMPLLPE